MANVYDIYIESLTALSNQLKNIFKLRSEFGLVPVEQEDLCLGTYDIRSMHVTTGGKLKIITEDGNFQRQTLSVPLAWLDMEVSALFESFKEEKRILEELAKERADYRQLDELRAIRTSLLSLLKVVDIDPKLKKSVVEQLTKGAK